MNDQAIAMSSPDASPSLPPEARSRLIVLAGVLATMMLAASIFAVTLRPKARTPGEAPGMLLETAIPKQFGDWREVPQTAVQVINPQTQELLDKLYSQTLSRTYVNGKGYAVMLSLAYGDDQRGGLQAHMPEVCYPAQGFTLHSISAGTVSTPWGEIAGKRVVTSLGQRREPITYWFAMGDRAVGSTLEKRLVEIRFGMTGQVPEGLLFRISSIDADSQTAFLQHATFAAALLAALPESDRRRVAGL